MNTKENTEISRDEIERLAHLKWESEGRPEGRSLQHWLDAERLLKTAKMAVAPKTVTVKKSARKSKVTVARSSEDRTTQ